MGILRLGCSILPLHGHMGGLAKLLMSTISFFLGRPRSSEEGLWALIGNYFMVLLRSSFKRSYYFLLVKFYDLLATWYTARESCWMPLASIFFVNFALYESFDFYYSQKVTSSSRSNIIDGVHFCYDVGLLSFLVSLYWLLLFFVSMWIVVTAIDWLLEPTLSFKY